MALEQPSHSKHQQTRSLRLGGWREEAVLGAQRVGWRCRAIPHELGPRGATAAAGVAGQADRAECQGARKALNSRFCRPTDLADSSCWLFLSLGSLIKCLQLERSQVQLWPARPSWMLSILNKYTHDQDRDFLSPPAWRGRHCRGSVEVESQPH